LLLPMMIMKKKIKIIMKMKMKMMTMTTTQIIEENRKLFSYLCTNRPRQVEGQPCVWCGGGSQSQSTGFFANAETHQCESMFFLRILLFQFVFYICTHFPFPTLSEFQSYFLRVEVDQSLFQAMQRAWKFV